MNFTAKKYSLLFSLNIRKIRWAYGISSKIKGSDNSHYLLFDIDSAADFSYFTAKYQDPTVCYQSRSGKGYHVIVFGAYSFDRAAMELLQCVNCDRSYIAQGIKRGYWFLETTIPLFFKELTFMRIER